MAHQEEHWKGVLHSEVHAVYVVPTHIPLHTSQVFMFVYYT